MLMNEKEVTLETITDSEDIQVGYSDSDIVVVDSIEKFTEVKTARVTMNAIVVCTSGKVHAQMNGQLIELHKNQVAIVPQKVLISDVMISPDFNLKALFLTNEILQSFLREKMNVWNDMMYVRRLHVISMESDDLVYYTYFYDILEMAWSNWKTHPFRTEVIQSLLRSTVLALCGAMLLKVTENEPLPSYVQSETDGDLGKKLSKQSYSTGNLHFKHFLDLLHSNHVKYRTVEAYAEKLCISPKYLTVICKRQSGKTANEWIREQVLTDICYYLRQTDLSIKQICDHMGFPNPSFFSKYVKQHLGMTPMQYRTTN